MLRSCRVWWRRWCRSLPLCQLGMAVGCLLQANKSGSVRLHLRRHGVWMEVQSLRAFEGGDGCTWKPDAHWLHGVGFRTPRPMREACTVGLWLRKPSRSALNEPGRVQVEDRIQVLRLEQRPPEVENVLNLVLDMAEEKTVAAKEKASPVICALRAPGLRVPG